MSPYLKRRLRSLEEIKSQRRGEAVADLPDRLVVRGRLAPGAGGPARDGDVDGLGTVSGAISTP